MDRVAFVTGGTRGIGLGCAIAFLGAGYDVAIAARSEAHGRSVGRELDGRGPGRCIFIPCDLGKPGSVESAVDAVVEAFGRIDALVNNAASFMPPTPIDDLSLVQLREMLEVNVVGYIRASQRALPHLRATKGSIVNIGSVAGANGLWREAAYCLSKAAILGLTKALAIEEAAHGVRVNIVLPGNIMVRTPSRRRGGARSRGRDVRLPRLDAMARPQWDATRGRHRLRLPCLR